ncbi:MAG: RsmE family RNA methyltransferase [Thermoleophilia bacterium]
MKHTFRYVAGDEVRPGAHVAISEADAHHLTRVVRRRAGDAVEVIDHLGRIWPATVVDDAGRVLLRAAMHPRPVPPVAPLTLYLGLADWGRLDLVVEKAAELGVERVVLTATERVKRRPDPDAWRRRRERLVRVAEAAARQSGQGHLMRVDGIATLDDALQQAGPGALLLDPRGTVPLGDAVPVHATDAVALFVGPDTGFSTDELARAGDAGACICTLGAATLRTETAALVAVSVALQLMGHLTRAPRPNDHPSEGTA